MADAVMESLASPGDQSTSAPDPAEPDPAEPEPAEPDLRGPESEDRREIESLRSQLEEARKSEAEGRTGEASFRFMVEHSHDVLFRGNYRTLQYDYLSPNIEQIAGGFTVDEIVAMGQAKWVARMRPEDVAQLGSILGELFSRGGGHYSTEFRIMGKDGVERWVNEVGTAFVDEEWIRPRHHRARSTAFRRTVSGRPPAE
jgi:PAS domain-containing protein